MESNSYNVQVAHNLVFTEWCSFSLTKNFLNGVGSISLK